MTQNKMTLTALAVSMTLGSTAVIAADVFPATNMSVTNAVTYTGDAETDAVINTRTEQGNDAVEGSNPALPAWDAANVAAGGVLTIQGYRDFRVENGSLWQYAVYAPYAGQINVDVERNISVAANLIAVHAMQDSEISLKAGNDISLTSNRNGLFGQNTSKISVESETGSVDIVTAGTTVGTGNATSLNSVEISIKSGKKITLENTSGGSAIRTQTNGGALSFEAPEGMEVTGNIDTTSGKVTFADNTSQIVVHGGSSAHFGELHGKELNFYFDDFAEGTSTLSVTDDMTEVINVAVGYEGMDRFTQEEAISALNDLYSTGERNGFGTNYTVRIDEKGNATVTGSDITKMTNDLAAASLVAWRNEITTLNDRMSTLRTSPSTIGAWVRYNGGEYQYDARSMKHQFNTIEVGADAKVSDNWIVGASFAYTKGDGDYEQGETETDTYSGAFYALWTHEKGSFVDFVMKAGRMENDFDFYNLTGGAYDNGTLEHTGFVMGIETGHRFALPMNAFVEPQLQLTYSRLSSVSETTAARHVELEAMDSLVGRVGIMAGIDCPNDRGSAYVKISALRDFRGDIDGTYSSVTGGGAYSLSQELDDNWFEYAVGGNFKLSDNAYLFADVAKSAGGDIDLDWRANVGAKLFF